MKRVWTLRMLVALSLLLVCTASFASAQPLWRHEIPGDPPLSLAIVSGNPNRSARELIAGYDSGSLVCFRVEPKKKGKVIWSVKLRGSVLCLQTLHRDDPHHVIAGTDLGQVACVDAFGKIRWSIETGFNTSRIAPVEDSNGDRISEVAVGGADHRVHLVSGADGNVIWSRLFEGDGETKYVEALCSAGDLNGDGTPDLYVRTWSGHRWAISGRDGSDVWRPRAGSAYLSVLATTPDLDGDGLNDSVESGNNGVLMLCGGKDGEQIWRTELGRPIRCVAISPTVPGQTSFDCFAGTAGGKVACVSSTNTRTATVRWTAEIGDVCGQLVTPGDVDRDTIADVIAGAENGLIAAYSGADGRELWRWQGSDTVRTLACAGDMDGDGVSDIAAALLDGTLIVLPGKPGGEQAASTPRKAVFPKAPSKHTKSARHKLSSDVSEVPILLYHDIPPRGIRPADTSPLENFRDQMDLLVAGGYTAVSLDEVADWIEGKGRLPAKPVCITFDGQYASHDTHVLDILKERNLFAVDYITSDWIGTENHMDWHQLRKLERSGVISIENHSVNHAFFPRLTREEMVQQLKGCNESICKHLGGKMPKHHAYPDGAFNGLSREVMKELGFRTATTVLHRRANRSDNVYSLPRYTISEDMPIETFKMIIGFEPPPCPAMDYKYLSDIGSDWRQPSFGAVDAQGKLWVCDYSANNVRVFLPDGTEASFSPLTEGLDQQGKKLALIAPSGVAITPSGEALITFGSPFGAVRHPGMFRYRGSDGQCLHGMELTYFPGDVDVDAQGLIYITEKLSERWHVYTPEGAEVSGSPFGQDNGRHVSRGIAVKPDGARVYIISETAHDVRVWNGSANANSAHYQFTGTLARNLSNESGAVDVMKDGTVFVSCHDEGMIHVFDAQHRSLGQISGGKTPSLACPRGVAFSSDGKTLWIMSRLGRVQRWEK